MVQPALTGSTVAAVTATFQKLLGKNDLDPNANFFDIGGTPQISVELFEQLSEKQHLKLSPLLIYAAPTIAQVSMLLEQNALARIPALLLLRKGKGERKIYIAHGLGGSVMELFELAKRLPPDATIYGLQARGSDGFEAPCESIEESADFFLDAISRHQANGPYSLIGYSLGGLITLEMARRIEARKGELCSHILIDSYLHPSHLAATQKVRLFARRAKRRLTGGNIATQPPDWQRTAAMQRLRETSERALRRYLPMPYSNDVKFIRAEKLTDFPADPRAAWKGIIRGLEVETVRGDHLELLSTHVDSLATALSRYLQF